MSAAETKRYELEDAIAALQEQSRAQTQPPSPSVARFSLSAAQIENETLRDQVVHLQSKLAALEDTLEDARATADKEEAMVHDRMKRFREKEEGLRAQVAEGEKELERVLKSEEGARARIEEIEEAFREATVALENARAEIEVLRAEIAVRPVFSACPCLGVSRSPAVSFWGRTSRAWPRTRRPPMRRTGSRRSRSAPLPTARARQRRSHSSRLPSSSCVCPRPRRSPTATRAISKRSPSGCLLRKIR